MKFPFRIARIKLYFAKRRLLKLHELKNELEHIRNLASQGTSYGSHGHFTATFALSACLNDIDTLQAEIKILEDLL